MNAKHRPSDPRRRVTGHGIWGNCNNLTTHRASSARHRPNVPGWRSVPLLAVLLLAGCSLISIKSPEIPLTEQEQDARVLTRDFALHFSSTMVQLIDEAVRSDADPTIRSQALRLKLGVVTESTRAATGLSPIGSLLDTWAFALQLRDFVATGAGASVLGGAQADVRQGATELADEADALARKVTGKDYSRYQSFVSRYAFRYPLESADCVRPSVLSAWMAQENGATPLRAVGTVAQALGDVSDRMRIYSEEIPATSLWQAERTLESAGFDAASYRAALRNIDVQLAKISTLADSSPALAHEAIAELRGSLLAVSDRLDNSLTQMLRSVRVEREALAANIATERQGLTAAFDVQRARISEDAARITARAVDTSWRELRTLVREALLLIILLLLLVLGLPFAAGYMVGRRRTKL
jgi:hypothetical protein